MMKPVLENVTAMHDDTLSYVTLLLPHSLNMSTEVWDEAEKRGKTAVVQHWSALINALRVLSDGDSTKMFKSIFSIMHASPGTYHLRDFSHEFGRKIIHDIYRQPGSGLRDVFTLEQFDAAWGVPATETETVRIGPLPANGNLRRMLWDR